MYAKRDPIENHMLISRIVPLIGRHLIIQTVGQVVFIVCHCRISQSVWLIVSIRGAIIPIRVPDTHRGQTVIVTVGENNGEILLTLTPLLSAGNGTRPDAAINAVVLIKILTHILQTPSERRGRPISVETIRI